MMRSLFSGISGLRNHQTRMDVIGNNIANVNTAGYKTARVIFQDIFSQNISAGMANQGDMGGTNPMQVGLGIRLSTVDVIHTRAAFQRTDRETDMMINGDGFFIVSQINPDTQQFETFYTRAGNFDIDNEGFLVTSQGFFVMGRTFYLNTGVVDPGNEAVAGRAMIRPGQFGAEIAGDPPTPANPLTRGIFRVGDVIPANTFQGQGDVVVTIDAANIHLWNVVVPEGADPVDHPMPQFAAGQRWPAAGETIPAITAVPFRNPVFGLVASDEPADGGQLTRIRATAERVRLPVDPITGQATGFPPRNANETDAAYTARLTTWIEDMERAHGTEEVGLPGMGVADNGDISVIVGNRKIVIGRLAIAMFSNPAGLEAAGNSLFRQTDSSGNVVVTEAFMDGAGKIEGGGLEMSNVDLANEFTDMIVTQRGFQANSRIVTVTDTMLEELVNLKR